MTPMGIDDSWQDRERVRKKRFRECTAQTDAEFMKEWNAHCLKTLRAYLMERALYAEPRDPDSPWPKAPDDPALALRKLPVK